MDRRIPELAAALAMTLQLLASATPAGAVEIRDGIFLLHGNGTRITVSGTLHAERIVGPSSTWIRFEEAHLDSEPSRSATLLLSVRTSSPRALTLLRVDDGRLRVGGEEPRTVRGDGDTLLERSDGPGFESASGPCWYYDSENTRIKHGGADNIELDWRELENSENLENHDNSENSLEVRGSSSPSSVDPRAAHDFAARIRDGDGLSDVDEVHLELYADGLSPDSPDGGRDHYSFKWVRGSGFSEVGPGDGEHLVESGCSAGDGGLKEGDWVFRVELGPTADPHQGWSVGISAADGSGGEDSREFGDEFEVNTYVSFSWDASSLHFDGNPGDENVPASQNPVVGEVDSNVNFDIRHRVDGPMENSSSDSVIPTSSMWVEGSGGGRMALSTDFRPLYSDVGYGEEVRRESRFYLDIPSPLEPLKFVNRYYMDVVES